MISQQRADGSKLVVAGEQLNATMASLAAVEAAAAEGAAREQALIRRVDALETQLASSSAAARILTIQRMSARGGDASTGRAGTAARSRRAGGCRRRRSRRFC